MIMYKIVKYIRLHTQ